MKPLNLDPIGVEGNSSSIIQGRLKGAIPACGILATDETSVFARFRELFDIAEASVLEVGGCIPASLAAAGKVARWHSVDPRRREHTPNTPTIVTEAPILSLPVSEQNTADLIFSCNAFQHIGQFEESLEHMRRLVRPGGYLYAAFGPIWSAPDGSHIEALEIEGVIYNFWEQTLLPSWLHLLHDEHSLRQTLEPFYGVTISTGICEYVFRSNWINRLQICDYLNAVEKSSWLKVAFLSSEEFGYEYSPPAIGPCLSEERILFQLTNKHGGEPYSFKVRDLEIILQAPG